MVAVAEAPAASPLLHTARVPPGGAAAAHQRRRQRRRRRANAVPFSEDVLTRIVPFLFLTCCCELAFATLLYLKLAKGHYLGWWNVTNPLCLAFFFSTVFSVMIKHDKYAAAQHAERPPEAQEFLVPALCDLLHGTGKILTVYFVVRHLQARAARSIRAALAHPVPPRAGRPPSQLHARRVRAGLGRSRGLARGDDDILPPEASARVPRDRASSDGARALTRRAIIPPAHFARSPLPTPLRPRSVNRPTGELRQGPEEVFWYALVGEGRIVRFCFFFLLAEKLDGEQDFTWSEAFLPVWVVLGVLLFATSISCCVGAATAPREHHPGVVFLALGATSLLCVLPPLVLALVFVALLAAKLDGTGDSSNATLLGLLVAYEVVCTVLLSSFFVLLDFVLTQQQREHQLLEGMRDHSETESGLPPGAAVPSEDMDSIERQVLEQRKVVRLVRESATFFRRAVAARVGFPMGQDDDEQFRAAWADACADAPAPGPGGAAVRRAFPALASKRNYSADALGKPVSDQERLCAICMVSTRDAMLQPCGHGGFCFACGKRLLATRTNCPLCRAEILEVLRYDSTREVVDSRGRHFAFSDKSARRT